MLYNSIPSMFCYSCNVIPYKSSKYFELTEIIFTLPMVVYEDMRPITDEADQGTPHP